MKRTLSAILFFLLPTLCIYSQQSLLWKISSPQSQTPSYILATIETPGVESFDIAASAAPVLNKINTVAFICLPTETEKQDLMSVMQMTGDNTMKRYFKREDQIRFELMVRDKLKAEPETYYKTKPLYLYELFRNYDHGTAAGYMQNQLYKTALEKTRPTLSLFTVRQLSAMMDETDFDTQARIMSDYVNRADAFLAADQKEFQAYFNQDLGELNLLSNGTENNSLNTYTGVLNQALADKINTISSGQSTLFIIDAEKLLGTVGIFDKLRSLGFTVTPENFVFIQKLPDTGSENAQTPDINSSEDVTSDNFPVFMKTRQTDSLNAKDIRITNIADTSNRFHSKYKGTEDPFGDLFDYQGADTSFLEKWDSLKATEGNFSAKIPEKADWVESSTQALGQTIKSYSLELNDGRSDLFYTVGYTVYPPDFDAGDKGQFFSQFVTRQMSKLSGKLLSQRIISTPEYTGREFTLVIDDSFFVHSKIILKNNILYQLLTGGPADNVYSKYAGAFFNSFKIGGDKTNNWYVLEQGAFTCNLPTPPGKSSQNYDTPNGPLGVQTFSAEDYRDNVSYFISVSSYPAGYKFKSNKAFYRDLIVGAERNYVGRVVHEDNVKKNGISGRYIDLQLNNGKIYKIYFFFDHNTVYECLAGGDPLSMMSPNIQYFFDTFKFNGEK